MADRTGTISVSATLDGFDPDIVTIESFAPVVEISNRDPGEGLWFMAGAEDPGAFDPGSDGALWVAPNSSIGIAAGWPTLVVRLVGDTNAYTVVALGRDGLLRVVPHNSLLGRSEPLAHDAASIDFDSGEGLVATDVAGALDELAASLATEVAGALDELAASLATDVAALDALAASLAGLDATAIACTKPLGMPGTVTNVQEAIDAIWTALQSLLGS